MSSIAVDGQRVGLGTALFRTTTVGASPAAASETIIGTLTLPTQIRADQNVFLFGWAAWTVGTSGTNSNLRIRQTNVGGTIVGATGAIATAAGVLLATPVITSDAPGAVANQVYVLTLTITAGAATSTVSALALFAIVV